MSDKRLPLTEWPPAPSICPSVTAYSKPGASPAALIAMGLLSWVFLGIVFGPVVWSKADQAIAGIRRGDFDPSNRIAYEVARVLGVLGAVIGVAVPIASVAYIWDLIEKYGC